MVVVVGTDGDDQIMVRQTASNLQVLSSGALVAQFGNGAVKALQVRALGGADTVDLRGDGAAVKVPAWVYGGGGDDTINGGSATNYLFGGDGRDTINGGGKTDYLWGDLGPNGAVDGGGGKDFVSVELNVTSAGVTAAGDVDIEAMGFEARSLLELTTRFRDPWGYSVMVKGDGPDGLGDATLHTALGALGAVLLTSKASGASLTALNDAAQGFLSTINTHSWDAAGNPIRHPLLQYLNANGAFLMVRPLSKDSMGAIVAACYYASKLPNVRADVKALAKQVLGKFVNFLPANQFRLVSQFTLDQIRGEIYERHDNGTLLKKKMTEVRSKRGAGAGAGAGPQKRGSADFIQGGLHFFSTPWHKP